MNLKKILGESVGDMSTVVKNIDGHLEKHTKLLEEIRDLLKKDEQ